MMLRSGIQTGLSAIYPARCLTCGTMVDSDFGLCGPCWRDTPFIGGTVCDGCGVPLPGEADGGTLHCDSCLTDPRPWEKGRAALIYRETGRNLVLALKHGDRQEIAKPAALWMSNALKGCVEENTLVVPIPLHWLRMVKRRYNQSALLAKALAKQLKVPWSPDLLLRHKKTRSLDGLNAAEREEVLKDAICVNPKRQHRIVGRPILLVDDVLTTGATLNAATQACLAAGSGPVRVVALARTVKDT